MQATFLIGMMIKYLINQYEKRELKEINVAKNSDLKKEK